ncbi:MAG: oligosaccharide flippase family protein [Chloroflexi bacterium]|nr:oligosaccharide flippase family protein [Chloroflexota bacterium]
MSGVNRLATNTTALLTAQAGVRLTSLIVVLLVGRLLGPEGLGLYAMASAVASLALVAADAGVDTVTVRAMAAGRPAARYLGALLPLRAVLLATAVAVAGAGAVVLGYPPAALALTLAFAVGSGLEIVAGSLRAALRAAETMVAEATLVTVGQGLRTLLVGGGLLLGMGLVAVGGGGILAGVGSLALALVVVTRRHGRPRPRLDTGLWRETVLQTAPVTAWVLLTQIGARSDAIIISQWWPTDEVGRFHAAAGVLSGLNLAVAMALAALYPPLVRAFAAGDERHARRLSAPILAGGLALAATMALLAPLVIEPLLNLLLGERFAGAGPPLLVLRWALPALVVSGVAGVTLRARHQDRPLAALALAGAGVSLALNLLLIPAQGALGAAVSTVAAEVVMAGVGAALLWRARLPLGRPLLAGALTGLLAGAAGLAAAAQGPAPWWLAALSAVAAALLVLAAAAGAVLLVRRGRARRLSQA